MFRRIHENPEPEEEYLAATDLSYSDFFVYPIATGQRAMDWFASKSRQLPSESTLRNGPAPSLKYLYKYSLLSEEDYHMLGRRHIIIDSILYPKMNLLNY